MKKQWLSVAECARELGVSTRTIYEQLWEQRVPGAKRVGRSWRIPASYAIPKGQDETAIDQRKGQ